MDTHNLHYVGDMEQTCTTPSSEIHSVIDLALVTEDLLEGTSSTVIQDKRHATGLDHVTPDESDNITHRRCILHE
jgi:hypothetical protein